MDFDIAARYPQEEVIVIANLTAEMKELADTFWICETLYFTDFS